MVFWESSLSPDKCPDTILVRPLPLPDPSHQTSYCSTLYGIQIYDVVKEITGKSGVYFHLTFTVGGTARGWEPINIAVRVGAGPRGEGRILRLVCECLEGRYNPWLFTLPWHCRSYLIPMSQSLSFVPTGLQFPLDTHVPVQLLSVSLFCTNRSDF
jgi:hypothetical protein